MMMMLRNTSGTDERENGAITSDDVDSGENNKNTWIESGSKAEMVDEWDEVYAKVRMFKGKQVPGKTNAGRDRRWMCKQKIIFIMKTWRKIGRLVKWMNFVGLITAERYV